MRWQKLKQLLIFAYHTIPFYRTLWQSAGIQPEKFTSERDMLDLPVVTKKELIEAQKNDAFLLSKKHGFEMAYTSGTTGDRFQVPFTFACYQKKYANHLRQVYACGWRLGMKSAAIHYSGHSQFKGKYSGRHEDREPFMSFREMALKLAHRRKILEPYNGIQTGDDTQVASWYEALMTYKPYMLETMDYVLLMLREYIERNGLQPLHIPKTYVLGTYTKALRERLESFFHTEIFNRFSPHEIEGVAYACEVHRGMHMAIDSYHVEFLDDNGRPVEPEKTGFLVVTDLDNYLMPLIRYKLGDLGHYYAEPCTCGRGFPLMGDIDGRARDLFALKNRSVVAPAKIAAILQDIPSVHLFQVVQDTSGNITAFVVPVRKPLQKETVVTIKNALHKLLGEDESITVIESDTITLEPNGKCSFVKQITP
ncbi:MAG: hypothetical protein N2171_06570 [Clostridia bacterium]|nr:hypothetical protein [Clostridia bacterium]